MRLTSSRRVLAACAAVVLAAGVAVAIEGDGGERDGGTPVDTTQTVQAPRISGHELAASLSMTTPIRTSGATIDEDTLRMVTAQEVETERAWPLAIPGDDRTAWLFAGPKRVALVVPRTVTDPERGRLPDTASVFGTRIADLLDQPLVASQVGGGQAPRTIVLVPEGVEAPRIVAQDGHTPIREMPHRGRLYVDQIEPGEELVIGRRRIGPTESG